MQKRVCEAAKVYSVGVQRKTTKRSRCRRAESQSRNEFCNMASGDGVTLNGRLADIASGGVQGVNVPSLLSAEGSITFLGHWLQSRITASPTLVPAPITASILVQTGRSSQHNLPCSLMSTLWHKPFRKLRDSGKVKQAPTLWFSNPMPTELPEEEENTSTLDQGKMGDGSFSHTSSKLRTTRHTSPRKRDKQPNKIIQGMLYGNKKQQCQLHPPGWNSRPLCWVTDKYAESDTQQHTRRFSSVGEQEHPKVSWVMLSSLCLHHLFRVQHDRYWMKDKGRQECSGTLKIVHVGLHYGGMAVCHCPHSPTDTFESHTF